MHYEDIVEKTDTLNMTNYYYCRWRKEEKEEENLNFFYFLYFQLGLMESAALDSFMDAIFPLVCASDSNNIVML